MLDRPDAPALWRAVSRTLRPTHGARANASEGLQEARRTRQERAEAAQAVVDMTVVVDVTDRADVARRHGADGAVRRAGAPW